MKRVLIMDSIEGKARQRKAESELCSNPKWLENRIYFSIFRWKFKSKMCKAFGFINVIASICASNQPSEVKNGRAMRKLCKESKCAEQRGREREPWTWRRLKKSQRISHIKCSYTYPCSEYSEQIDFMAYSGKKTKNSYDKKKRMQRKVQAIE